MFKGLNKAVALRPYRVKYRRSRLESVCGAKVEKLKGKEEKWKEYKQLDNGCCTFGFIRLILRYTKYTLSTSFPLIVIDATLI